MEKTSSPDRHTLIDLEIGNSNSPNLKSINPNEDDLENSDKKKKQQRLKKPPKPPRPPRPVPLDLSDQKLVNELTEIAMLKKARMERMKALKKLKNSKPASGNSNWCPLLVTVIFCIVIFWHGLFSRGSGGIMGFHGSPEASFVSVQTYKNNNASPTISPGGSTVSSSPKTVEPESGLEIHGEKNRVVG
ncbi:hypothetical protein FCM35_KLT09349 [Carex littledalei]|uniref:Transmembrane protein n=1 Tax=Carex littledalei TaxID=544730 RepID=A0A833R1D4_9POAL|nr:hypothetical protein FCM35_KLT09349 [Carex littledalei]